MQDEFEGVDENEIREEKEDPMRNEFDGVDVNNVQREKVGPMQHEFEEVDAKEVQGAKVDPSSHEFGVSCPYEVTEVRSLGVGPSARRGQWRPR